MGVWERGSMGVGGMITGHEELDAYKLAFRAAMEIFRAAKSFLRDEVYSLTDQVRRSSRSVCANSMITHPNPWILKRGAG